MSLSFDDEESFKEVVGSLRFDNPPSDPNSIEAERNEDICFNDSTSDPNSLGLGGVDSTAPQERSERSDDIDIIAA
jgi:hypothetical protein